MSHRDTVVAPPDGRAHRRRRPSTRRSRRSRTTARKLYGVQFHPEVVHTPHGQDVLKNFLYEVAGAAPAWTPAAVIEEQVERIRAQVGSERVLCALSGGVDSAVAALLVHKAVGDQLTCVFVDHGLLRKGEAEQVVETFDGALPRAARARAGAGAVPREARRRHRPRAEAQDHRRGVHPRLRGRGAEARRRRRGSCRARSTPT